MRIIFLSSSLTPSGGARQAVYLAQGLAGRGHHVSFCAPTGSVLPHLDRAPGQAPGHSSGEGRLDWVELPAKRSGWRKAVQAALPPISAHEPCVVHAVHNRAVKKLAWWGLFWRRRMVVTVAGRGVCYRPGNPLPYLSPGLDAIVANSAACARVLARIGAPRSKLHVIHNGIAPERLHPGREREAVRQELSVNPAQLLAVSVAGDKPVKGVDVLLKAWALAAAQMKGAGHPPGNLGILAVIGIRPDKFAPLAAELGITASVRLLARTERVADYLAAADLFVLPSRSESMPNTLLEAVCLGLPVVATDVGGVSEAVHGNGLLVPPEDPAAMAQALARLTNDPAAIKAMAQASRELAPAFSLETKVAASENLYRNLFARRLISV